jgi:hypothetical protein
MSNLDFKGVRLASYNVKEKLHRGVKITQEELESVKKHAQMNSTGDSIALYALAKRSLEENKDEE